MLFVSLKVEKNWKIHTKFTDVYTHVLNCSTYIRCESLYEVVLVLKISGKWGGIQIQIKSRNFIFLYGGFENQKKKCKNNLTLSVGIWTQDFSTIFPPMIWIFSEGEGDEIKSRQPSKKDRTLQFQKFFYLIVHTYSHSQIYWAMHLPMALM